MRKRKPEGKLVETYITVKSPIIKHDAEIMKLKGIETPVISYATARNIKKRTHFWFKTPARLNNWKSNITEQEMNDWKILITQQL